MHGLIFTSFAQFAERDLGVSVDGAYAVDRAYADDEFEALVRRAAAAAGVTEDELLRSFGRYAATTAFARLYPAYYEESTGTRAFLLGVEKTIHEVVRRTIPDARPPRLRVTPLGELGVIVTYTSERQLCPMLEGLILGVAEHYGEQVELEHAQCTRREDVACAVIVQPA